MSQIGIGIVGGGYMGKAHAVAYASVGAVFDTKLRPVLEMVCATTPESAERYRAAFGFKAATDDWRVLVENPAVEAVVIASPQQTHRDIALAAFALGKPVFCEKPLGATVEESREMVATAEAAGVANMVGFNYIRTPASQFARHLIKDGRIGRVTNFRAEMTEDFLADPDLPANWRTEDRASGTLGDLSPHIINAAHAFMGPMAEICSMVETVHKTRGGVAVTNDDQAQMMIRFENGVMGSLYISRIATGRKMGYAYHIDGTDGALWFDGEDQNAVHLFTREGPGAEQGFRKILTGPDHPDFQALCPGVGHGTGYQDQIIIEAKDFLTAIETGEAIWPTFEEGMEVNRVVAAAWASSETRSWVNIKDF